MSLVSRIVTYGSETWALKVADRGILKKIKRIVLARIFGTVKEGEVSRRMLNKQLECLIEDTVRFIKLQRIRWLHHIH